MDCYVKTIRADGVRGLYRGFWISCSCIFIYRGLYFGLYDTLKPLVLGANADWIYTFLLGWGVTIVSGISAYPLDTVKRRMMMTAGQEVKYSSSWACAKELVAREGRRAFFKGAGVNIVRGVAGAGGRMQRQERRRQFGCISSRAWGVGGCAKALRKAAATIRARFWLGGGGCLP